MLNVEQIKQIESKFGMIDFGNKKRSTDWSKFFKGLYGSRMDKLKD